MWFWSLSADRHCGRSWRRHYPMSEIATPIAQSHTLGAVMPFSDQRVVAFSPSDCVSKNTAHQQQQGQWSRLYWNALVFEWKARNRWVIKGNASTMRIGQSHGSRRRPPPRAHNTDSMYDTAKLVKFVRNLEALLEATIYERNQSVMTFFSAALRWSSVPCTSIWAPKGIHENMYERHFDHISSQRTIVHISFHAIVHMQLPLF